MHDIFNPDEKMGQELGQDTLDRDSWPKWTALLIGGTLLGYGLMRRKSYVGIASAVAGSALLYGGSAHEQELDSALNPVMEAQRTITVEKNADELYRFWKDVKNFPVFMEHVKSVEEVSPRLQHWVMALPGGKSLAWDSEVVADDAARHIAWHTLPDSLVAQKGLIEFKPVDSREATEVRMTVQYRYPGGRLTGGIAMLFGREGAQMMRENLRRFKQLIETGEIATTLGQPAGKRGAVDSFAGKMLGERTRQWPAGEEKYAV